ncbi:MAG: carboxypeptidase-like regulatory domain-containing protein [Myxococcota bacterium]
MLALLVLVACSDTQTVTGRVFDVWGDPLDGATVVVEGVLERHYTDDAGQFSIEVEDPVNRVMVGKQGFIKDVTQVAPPIEEDADYDPLSFRLYPEPEKPGFYGVGFESYVHLPAKRIRIVGTELKHYAGVLDYPEDGLPAGKPITFVFSSTLRASELARMNLHLSRLDFVNKTKVKGVLGAMDATVNLWVAAEEVEFDLRALPSTDDYLITTRESLEPGVYAFHAQDVLNEEDERVLMNLPKEMQVAFPFEVI